MALLSQSLRLNDAQSLSHNTVDSSTKMNYIYIWDIPTFQETMSDPPQGSFFLVLIIVFYLLS